MCQPETYKLVARITLLLYRFPALIQVMETLTEIFTVLQLFCMTYSSIDLLQILVMELLFPSILFFLFQYCALGIFSTSPDNIY